MVTKLAPTYRPAETRDAALWRLAAQASRLDIRVYEHEDTGEYFATSYSSPDRVHRVSRLHCSCAGYARHQRCMHHAALLAFLNELPDPTPTPPGPAVICPTCDATMTHINGVTFTCTCGRTFAPDWQPIDDIDRRLCERSQTDPDLIPWIERMLAPGGDRVPAGMDPDQLPGREDVATALELWAYSSNEIAATLIWRADVAETTDREVA